MEKLDERLAEELKQETVVLKRTAEQRNGVF